MQGILFNLFLSEGFSILESQDKAKALLKSNGFLTIKERNKLICQNIKEKTEKNESFTLYDVQPTDYDRQYVSIKKFFSKTCMKISVLQLQSCLHHLIKFHKKSVNSSFQNMLHY